MSKLTACGKIAELSSMSTTAAEKCRLAQHQSPYREKQTHYNEGKAVAYSESYDILKRERFAGSTTKPGKTSVHASMFAKTFILT